MGGLINGMGDGWMAGPVDGWMDGWKDRNKMLLVSATSAIPISNRLQKQHSDFRPLSPIQSQRTII